MANIVYRTNNPGVDLNSVHTSTIYKGATLTNVEVDKNFYSINEDLGTKAPINNAAFTGTTTIPNVSISGGSINGTVIGGVTPAAATFTALTTTGNLSVGDASTDILTIQAGSQTAPSLVRTGDLNTGVWFPADDTIAVSAGGSERIRATSSLVTVTGNQTITGDLAVNDGDITTTVTGTATLFNTNATTLNIGGAATSLTIGATTGTATIRNANVVLQGDLAVNGPTSADVTTTTTTATLFNATATTLSIGGAATTLNIGNAAAAQTINLGNASTGASTYNVGTGATASTFTKTVNLGTGGAAGSTTNINIGSGVAGSTTINSGTVLGANATQNLWNTVATTINFGGAATTLEIGAATGTTNINNNLDVDGDVNIDGGDLTVSAGTFNLAETNATTVNFAGAATTLNIGNATAATATIRPGTVVGENTTQNLWNTVATTVNFAGAGTTVNIGNAAAAQTINLGNASTGASTYNIGTGATATATTKTINLGTGGAAGSTTNVNIGSGVAGSTTINSGTVLGANTTQNLWNTVATTVNFAGAATTIEIGAATGTTNINNNLDVDGTLNIDGASLTTSQNAFNLIDTTVATLNFARAGTAITIGATTGTTTIRNASVVLEGDLAVNGATSADITTTTTAATVFNANATTLSIGGAATTLNLGNAAAAQTISIGNASTGTSTYNIGTGATASTFTKTINIGTGGVTGSTTNINIGSSFNGTTTVNNNASLNGTLTVAGASTFNGNVTFGNETTDTVSYTARLASGLTWATDNTNDIGANGANRPRDFFLGRNASIDGTLFVNGATTLNGSVSSNSTITGTQLISNVSVGTAPLTVTSTTKVANLNVDRVDDISFATPIESGGIAYVSATSAGNHTVSFINAGVSGTILTSSGGGAPTWTPISGVSAGSSFSTRHVLGGNTGDMLYQNIVTRAVTTTNGSAVATMTSTTGILAGMIVEGNANIPAGTLIQSVDSGTQITLSQNATGSATSITTSFLETKKLPIGSTNQVLQVSGGIPSWGSNLTVGTVSHTGLVATAGTNVDQLYTVTDNLTVTTGWVNTSINAAELPTGSYIIQLTTGTEVYTGMMSWYSANISSTVVDEIVLHKASAGTETTNALFLRVERTDNDTSPDMTLQISSASNRAAADYTFRFRRMI